MATDQFDEYEEITVTFTVKANIRNIERLDDGRIFVIGNGNTYDSVQELVEHELERDLQNIKVKEVKALLIVHKEV